MLTSIAHTRERLPFLTIFRIFLRLGLTSFGGLIAHLGYSRREFVEKRKWLDEHAYADRVSLRQFLPRPASSRVAGILPYWESWRRHAAIQRIMAGINAAVGLLPVFWQWPPRLVVVLAVTATALGFG